MPRPRDRRLNMQLHREPRTPTLVRDRLPAIRAYVEAEHSASRSSAAAGIKKFQARLPPRRGILSRRMAGLGDGAAPPAARGCRAVRPARPAVRQPRHRLALSVRCAPSAPLARSASGGGARARSTPSARRSRASTLRSSTILRRRPSCTLRARRRGATARSTRRTSAAPGDGADAYVAPRGLADPTTSRGSTRPCRRRCATWSAAWTQLIRLLRAAAPAAAGRRRRASRGCGRW